MAAGDEATGQAQAVRIRVARLAADGSPLEGDGNLYVTDGLIQMEWAPDIATGDELEQTNGAGDECLYFRAPDRTRKLNLTLGLCKPEPELLEMLMGGTLHALSSQTTGYGHPGTGAVGEGVSDVSIELWQNLIANESIIGQVRHVYPRTRQWRHTGATHQNELLDTNLEGFGYTAGLWGAGPAGDWDLLSDEDVNLYDWALETQAIPAAVIGAQTLNVPT